MVRLRSFTQVRLFHLDKVSDLGFLAHHHTGTQMGKGAQVRAVLNMRIGKYTVIENLDTGTDHAIGQSCEGPQHTIFPNGRGPFEHHVGIQHRVSSDRDRRIDPG